MEPKVKNERGREFASTVAASLSAALSLATGSVYSLDVTDSYDAQGKSAAKFRIKVSGGLSGDCYIEFNEGLVAKLATSAQGNEEIGAKEISDVLASAVEASTRVMGDSLKPQFGPLEFAVEAVSDVELGEMWMAPVASAEDGAHSALQVYVDKGLLDSLGAAATAETASDDQAPVQPSNLKLVMDVELNVSLRFGQRQMPLRDVLALASGSVVELDRKVDEPVELLLDGKLVARGEAVIVDGNYGLRVTEIPQSLQSHFLN
jgi:flagellar motor switch protein FliN